MKKVYFILLGLAMLIVLPILLWFLEDKQHIRLAVIDKTVPNESFREHLGLTWLLNHLNYVDQDGNRFHESSNYYGVKPDLEQQNYEWIALPEDYSDYDVIYLADTYGVYEEDVPWAERIREGRRSGRIYGGMSEQEWRAVVERLDQPRSTLLIAEYNAFASPTNKPVRDSMMDVLGVEWSGWTGRYFKELDPYKNLEVPQWIIDQYGPTWNYSGEGFLLVNDFTNEVVVLEFGKHVDQAGIRFAWTDQGTEWLGESGTVPYHYWFDIVVAAEESIIYADYNWSLTEEGEALLQAHNIPQQFDAVISTAAGSYRSYYFAGDFNDVMNVPFFYQMKGLDHLHKYASRFSDDWFYWAAYVPLMKQILQTFVAEETTKSDHANVNDPVHYSARIHGEQFEVLVDGKWQPMPIKGVNMGMAKPGYFPGEAAIMEEDYYRWMEAIGEMNANTIRVYTLHPPGFYRALKKYNDVHENKLYIFHGVWIDELGLEETLDGFDERITREFQEEIKKVADAVHGQAIIPAQPGHASGVYRADVSEYVIGWILGIEWYPFMVLETNESYRGMEDFSGNFVETKGAEPFEIWLAKQMEFVLAYERERYNAIRPVSFTNWPTTDILDHPSDLTGHEDIVSIDPNVIFMKGEAALTGQFASYHVYPYYPDFMNYDLKYRTFTDHRGEYNNYAGYLNELNETHRLPILIAEFGVPASRGLTHQNIFGWNQGFLTELEQGEILKRLYEDIMDEKMLGGLIFTWQDEWFKRTWNTMDYDHPERRPYWSNAQTNEQQFGILSFDRHKIRVDGEADDWEVPPLFQTDRGPVRALYADHDERYLYLRLDLRQGEVAADEADIHASRRDGKYPYIVIDSIPGQGDFYDEVRGLEFQAGVEFVIDFNGEQPRMLVDDYYDFFMYQYGFLLGMIDKDERAAQDNNGRFVPIYYALNREYYNPETNETYPFSSYEAGALRHGNANPDSPEYDSLADYYINKEDGLIEMRIPWLLLHAKDPSRKEFTGNLHEGGGMEASVTVDQIYIGAVMPATSAYEQTELAPYDWEPWDFPRSEERLKQSYEIIQQLFARY